MVENTEVTGLVETPATGAPVVPASSVVVASTETPAAEAAGQVDDNAGSPNKERSDSESLESDKRAERRLRWATLAWFGILFFLSYAPALFLVNVMNSPLTDIWARQPLDEALLLMYIVLALLGILMLLSVFFRRVFHVLSVAVLAMALLLPVLNASGNSLSSLPYATLFFMFLGIPRQSFAWLLDIIGLICWLLPFAAYYLPKWRHSRSRKQPPVQ
ncbi:MAG: hypothetical protein LBU48_00180 [Coriobacteriales bacterium]|jgi:hypothetical protein|nr:hypothetical protein [Coriobacteriales bacterium]